MQHCDPAPWPQHSLCPLIHKRHGHTAAHCQIYHLHQLLPLLRVDSVGSAVAANGQTVIQFTGSDGHVYAIEASPDLVNWARIGTNWPAGGVINFTNSSALGATAQFYRSALLQ